METTNSKSTKPLSHSKTGSTRSALALGGIVVLLIAIVPFLFYAYESFPGEQIWETSLFTWETSFPSWYAFGWYFIGKFIPLYLLLLWFFTCKHWWHWIILVPIAMYSFQLWGVINESNNLDELDFYYIIPLLAIIVPFVYLIRAKLFNKIRGKDLNKFEQELLEQKSAWGQIKDLFQ